jgi:hypothetical protein
MHTGVVQNKSIACQADRFLLDGKKEKFSCPIFLLQSNLLLKKTATNVHGSQCQWAFVSEIKIITSFFSKKRVDLCPKMGKNVTMSFYRWKKVQ